MEEYKQQFIKKLNNFIDLSVDKSVEEISSFGTAIEDATFKQYAFTAETSLEEVCHIRPNNPLYKPGTLLTSPDGIQGGDDGCIGLKCASDSEMDISIHVGIIKNIEELGELRRYLVAETIMITDESIQITKHSTVRVVDGVNKSAIKQNCVFSVRHFIHGLDNKQKILIPTRMFKESKNKWSDDLMMFNELDLNIITKIYNSSDPEDIIAPLKIHNDSLQKIS